MKTRCHSQVIAIASAIAFAPMVQSAATRSVSDVPGLMSEIAAADAGDVIKLAKGDYYLSSEPCMNSVGHLYIGKAISLKGATGNPADVVLIGSTNRILHVQTSAALMISDITFKNGNCTNNALVTTSGVTSDRQTGGAICFHVNRTFGGAVVSNCVFSGNVSKRFGGAIGNNYSFGASDGVAKIVDCVFTNNTSAGDGGAVASAIALVKCKFFDNTSTSLGGAAYHPHLIDRCEFVGNHANGSSGGAAMWAANAGDCAVSNSTFRLNHAAKKGGALHAPGDGTPTVFGCDFEGNSVDYSTTTGNSDGGAIYGFTNGVYCCTFTTNYACYGGAVGGCSSVTGCTFHADLSVGTAKADVADGSNIEGCTFVISGAANTLARNCNISGTSFAGKIGLNGDAIFNSSKLDRCRMENLTKASGSNWYFARYKTAMTNCLVANCSAYAYSYNLQDGAGFYNCTFVSNSITKFTAATSASPCAPVVNCLFWGNKVGSSYMDIDDSATNVIIGFTNCVFHASSDGSVPGFGNVNRAHEEYAVWNPKFMFSRDAANPYTLQLSSPARGWGAVSDWMADSSDLVGNPRLRDGKVDIGCYECWLSTVGFVMMVK